MPTVVIRRTRVIADRVESKAFTSDVAQRVFVSHALGSATIGSILPTAAVAERALGSEVLTRRKFSYMVQFGTLRCGTPRYVTFPRTYAATPYVALTPLQYGGGTLDKYAVTSRRLGSFQAQGSITGNVMYISYGSA